MAVYKIDTKGWQAFAALSERLARSRVRVGVFGDKAAEPHGDGRISNGEAAVINEFGTDDIPARPFVKQTFTKNAEIGAMLAAQTRAVLEKRVDENAALLNIAQWGVEQVRHTIDNFVPPPNEADTLRRKAPSTLPLIHTGQLYNAIGGDAVVLHEAQGGLVEEGGGEEGGGETGGGE